MSDDDLTPEQALALENAERFAEMVQADEAQEQSARYRDLFPALDLARLLDPNRPEREWVVGSLIPAGASVSLVAPAGTGKSLLLLALCVAVARGDDRFAGLPVTRRRVLYVDMENTEDDLAERFEALAVTAETLPELQGLVFLHLPALDPLDTALGADMLAGILDAYRVGPGDVVVLDSLQRVTQGPENDSDTLRALYRHTSSMLKRRGLTVVRTDNTGKDAEKGARGTSGKKDDVDVELLLTRDAETGDLRIKVGKVRLPGIEPLRLTMTEDYDGRLIFDSGDDPHRRKVAACVSDIQRIAGDLDELSNRKVTDAFKSRGWKYPQKVIREAVREAKQGVSRPSDTPTAATTLEGVSPTQRHTPTHPEPGSVFAQVDAGFERVAPEEHTRDTPTPGAPVGGVSSSPPSKGRHTHAHSLPEADLLARPEPDLEQIARDTFARCSECEKPLAPLLIDKGHTAHPSCTAVAS